jgi:hypothetical protein
MTSNLERSAPTKAEAGGLQGCRLFDWYFGTWHVHNRMY